MSFVPLSQLTSKPSLPVQDASTPAKPLFLKYRTEAGYYAYDVNTAAIIQLTPGTFALLDFLPFDEDGEVEAQALTALSRRLPLSEIALGIEQLRQLTLRFGLFKPVNIQARMFPPEFVRERVSNIVGHLNQLVLSVAEQCNLRCSYCAYSGGYVNTRVHNSTMMPWSVARKAMDFFLGNLGTSDAELGFYGGEPLINVTLMRQCVDYMQTNKPRVRFGLTTNGTLLTDDVIKMFIAVDMRLLISLDGPEEIHDRERRFVGGQASFAKVMETVNKIKAMDSGYYDRKVRFQCTLRPNDDAAAVLDFFASNGALFYGDKVNFGRISAGHRSYDNLNKTVGSDQNAALEQRYLDKIVAGDVHGAEFSALQAMFEKPYVRLHYRVRSRAGFGNVTHSMGACFPGHHRVFVKADGHFQICEKSNESLVIGHVDTGFDLEKILSVYETFFELHNRECRRCWAYRFCPSCYVSSTRETGRFESSLDPAYCSNVRQKWSHYLANYSSVLERAQGGFNYMEPLHGEKIPVMDDGASAPAAVSNA
jgi:uncharacterized protein